MRVKDSSTSCKPTSLGTVPDLLLLRRLSSHSSRFAPSLTVNSLWRSTLKQGSNYRRIQRFFAAFTLGTNLFGRLMLTLLPQKDELVVSIDRTTGTSSGRSNRQLGQFHINILMLSIVYKGVAFPIVWSLLGKAGNSNRAERRALLERFLGLVAPSRIRSVVADREFIGKGWFADLKAFGLPFYIRIKHNARVGSKGRTRHAGTLFESLRLGETRMLPKRRWVYGHRLRLVGVKLADSNHRHQR